MAKTKILVLGAGFGGLELSSILSAVLGSAAAITLIDQVRPTAGFMRPRLPSTPRSATGMRSGFPAGSASSAARPKHPVQALPGERPLLPGP